MVCEIYINWMCLIMYKCTITHDFEVKYKSMNGINYNFINNINLLMYY